jgi:hypothetical protein
MPYHQFPKAEQVSDLGPLQPVFLQRGLALMQKRRAVEDV